MNAFKLYNRYSKLELLKMQEKLCDDPINRNTELNSIFRYNLKTRKKLDNIAQAITYHLDDDRKNSGNPVLTDGYSGRNSNK